MLHARESGSREEIEASADLGRGEYECPCCGGRVFLRAGLTYTPHFAHYEGEGTDACEEYTPGSGDNASPDSASANPPEEVVEAIVEDVPEEIGVSISGVDEAWSVLLHVPEISNDELGTLALSELRHAAVQVYAGHVTIGRISALDLRPGVVSVPFAVPPAPGYEVSPVDGWPRSFPSDGRRLFAQGINPKGTLFQLKRGEWKRLRRGAAVQWGDALVVLADRRAAPPSTCEPTPKEATTFAGLTWQVWRVKLPTSGGNEAAKRWLQELGVDVHPPTWRIGLLTAPSGLSEDGRTIAVRSGVPIIAVVHAPIGAKEGTVVLSGGTDRHALRLAPAASPLYLELTPSTLDRHVLRMAGQVHVAFDVVPEPSTEDVRGLLSDVPRLCVTFGDFRVDAWSEKRRVEISRQARRGIEVRVEPAISDVSLNIAATARGRRHLWSSVTPNEAAQQIGVLLRAEATFDLMVDADALGVVRVRIAPALESSQEVHGRRTTRWLYTIAASSVPGRPQAAAVTRSVRRDSHLLIAVQRSSSIAVANQIRANRARGRRS